MGSTGGEKSKSDNHEGHEVTRRNHFQNLRDPSCPSWLTVFLRAKVSDYPEIHFIYNPHSCSIDPITARPTNFVR